MIRTVWLNSVVILDKAAQVYVDIYGLDFGKTWIIQSKSFNRITTVVDAWSV